MKKVYWRPRGVSRAALALIAVLAVAGLVSVEYFQIRTRQPYYSEKVEAAALAREAFEFIKDERPLKDIEIDPEADPTQSGLIGTAMSLVTSDPGSLAAKETTVNPNWAAVIVQMVKEAGVKEGDVVAVGCSGSFPALNICTYAALAKLNVKPVVISSAAASQWGANVPEFLWVDMERVLHEYHYFDFRSVAASIGGVEDRGLGMSAEGRDMLRKGIARSSLESITPKTFVESMDRRMALYHQYAKGAPIKAYINVGGGTISVGTRVGKRMFEPGLTMKAPPGALAIDSIMTRMSKEGAAVIHLTQIEQLANQYGLPIEPKTLPQVGEGKVYYRLQYNHLLAVGVLLVIVLSLYAFIRTELGYRLLQSSRPTKHEAAPGPMI
jgi:poly-gamma-glutamate system protein